MPNKTITEISLVWAAHNQELYFDKLAELVVEAIMHKQRVWVDYSRPGYVNVIRWSPELGQTGELEA